MLPRVRTALLLAVILAIGLPAIVVARDPGATGHPFPARIGLPDGWQPEGIASHGDVFYAGSLADGAIWRGSLRTGRGRVFVPGVTGKVAVGVDFDEANHRIWTVGGPTGEVRAYDARSGALLRTYTFGAGFLNDLVVTRHAVFATDSFLQQLDVIPLGEDGALPSPSAATTLPLTGDISFVPNAFNANGIVRVGRWLVIVQSQTGQLFRVNPETGNTRLINTHGYNVSFGDGLELHGRTLYVVRNQLNLVAVLRLGRLALSARLLGELASPSLDVPTTATFGAGRLWVVNARFNTPPTPTTPYWVTRLPAHP